MSVSANFKRLIDAAEPYWAAEAEVFRTYWTWDKRTRETDRKWLALQCSKEVWGSGFSDREKGMVREAAEQLIAAFPKIDEGEGGIDRHTVVDIAEGLWAEFAHYCAFADAYDALGLPGEPKISPRAINLRWAEDDELGALRIRHRREHPALGERAMRFTEGGYCTLFTEGMKLATQATGPHARANAVIAEACTKVYDDEFNHMLKGIIGLDDEGLSEADWRLLEQLSLEQLKLRVKMRNSQFGYPLSGKQLEEALAGRMPPLRFDYEKAQDKIAA